MHAHRNVIKLRKETVLTKDIMKEIALPPPNLRGEMSVEQAIAQRRSRRYFQPRPLTLAQIGQLLWAASGISDAAQDRRTAPAAGALYPCEVYAAWSEGVFVYRPQGHRLAQTQTADVREALAWASGQEFVADAPCVFVVTAVYERTTRKYGARGRERYVPMDVGHLTENLLLQAVALGLSGTPVGAFDDKAVRDVMALPAEEEPFFLVLVGWAK
jgi:SagB-type dehydrogenase family enzyme